ATVTPIRKAETPSGPKVKRVWHGFESVPGPELAARTGRTNGDEELIAPNGGADQGFLHLDSEIGKLWIDLVSDNRESNSKVNEIARLGERLGVGDAEIDKDILPRLKEMKADAPDSAVAERIQETIDELTVPEVKDLDIPEGTPPVIREWLEQMAKVPTMRKIDSVRRGGDGESVLSKKLAMVRRAAAGERIDEFEFWSVPHE